MRAWRLVALVVALALAGCAGEACRREPVPPPVASGPSGPSAPQQVETRVVVAWLVSGEKLYRAERDVPATPRVGAAAMEALLAGPTPEEAAQGVTTAIPAGTAFHGLVVRDGTALVDLSRDFESGGGALALDLRVGQVVLTLTQFPSVKSVRFVLDGTPVDTLSGDGYAVDQPLGAADFQRLLPPG